MSYASSPEEQGLLLRYPLCGQRLQCFSQPSVWGLVPRLASGSGLVFHGLHLLALVFDGLLASALGEEVLVLPGSSHG